MNHALRQKDSGLYPMVGELWDCEGRVAVIVGNSISENGTLWVMDWDSGASGYFKLTSLKERPDRFSVDDHNLIEKYWCWAETGNADAMWFLAWWYEAVNHQRSVWLYVAALRADPDKHKWAYGRIVADAKAPSTSTIDSVGNVTRYPQPDLRFLDDIPEMNEPKIHCAKWLEAVMSARLSPEVMPTVGAVKGSSTDLNC